VHGNQCDGESYIFTSESVTEGHPDKVCDQIADAVLDAILAREADIANKGGQADPAVARVACEALATTGLVVLAGEIRSEGYVDIESVTRRVIADIGYVHPELGFDAASCGIINSIHEQSPDIAQGVDESYEAQGRGGEGRTSCLVADSANAAIPTAPVASTSCGTLQNVGAGDQGTMFGFACNETETLMPMPIFLAHRLAERLAEVRKDGSLPYLRPDGKTQVSVRYRGGCPVGVEKILISTQHSEGIAIDGQLHPDLKRLVVAPVMERWGVSWQNAELYVNPTGRFVIGGPSGDTGLTGRKIIVDTYGGSGRHGGGSFSGKDATKVDRSAAYAARWAAKNLVAAGLAERCELQVAYAIGMSEPFSVMVESFGTGQLPDELLTHAVLKVFDLRPGAIIRDLGLTRPIFRETAAYGHFGRELPEFTWERTDRIEELLAVVRGL